MCTSSLTPVASAPIQGQMAVTTAIVFTVLTASIESLIPCGILRASSVGAACSWSMSPISPMSPRAASGLVAQPLP